MSAKRARVAAVDGNDSGGEDDSKYTKGTWCKDEDDKLIEAVQLHGIDNWKAVAAIVTGRSAKQCRDRYKLKLDPTINHGPWTKVEDDRLLELAGEYGRAWTKIARNMPGRTENAVKSRISSLERSKTKDWSAEEDALLTDLRRKNVDFELMTKHFPSRSSHAIKKRWETLHMDELTRKLKQDISGGPAIHQPQAQQHHASIPEAIILGQPMSQAGFNQQMSHANSMQGAQQMMQFSSAPMPMLVPYSPMMPIVGGVSQKMPNGSQVPVHPAVQNSRLQRHSTSMTVLLQVLGENAVSMQASPLRVQHTSTLREHSSFSLPGPFLSSNPSDATLGGSNEGETPKQQFLKALGYDDSKAD